VPQPGWYADPWSPHYLRWWDGGAWTGHILPRAGGGIALDGRRALGDEALAATRARWALVFGFVLQVAVATYAAFTTHHLIEQLRAALRAARRNDGSANQRLSHVESPSVLISYPLQAGLIAVGVLFLIWFHRSASLARNLGLPASRSPLWAVLGFFVPVVNLWFPYQVARDLFPRDDPARSLVRQWWAGYLLASLSGFGVLAAAWFSTATAVVVTGVVVIVWAFAANRAWRLIEAAVATHRRFLTAPNS
jgi:hypothetical protein